jgi:hypothetical protein
MSDRKKLQMLIELVREFAAMPGNEWMKEEIWAILKGAGTQGTIQNDALFQSIYEYCIEERIRIQANEFYICFPVEELRKVLIEDFIKMEHERRRNDFRAVGLCVYQQIEAMMNYLFKEVVEPQWEADRKNVVTKFHNKNSNSTTTKTLEQEVFYNDKSWDATAKFKAVSYYCYFEKQWPFYEVKPLVSQFREIYILRNQVHRDISKNPDSKGFDRVSLAFRSYHFLADYVQHIRIFLLTKEHGTYEKAMEVYGSTLKAMA